MPPSNLEVLQDDLQLSDEESDADMVEEVHGSDERSSSSQEDKVNNLNCIQFLTYLLRPILKIYIFFSLQPTGLQPTGLKQRPCTPRNSKYHP